MIHIDLVPNFENDDYEIIQNLINGKTFNFLLSENRVREILKLYFPEGEIFFFNSARSALTFLLSQNYSELEQDSIQIKYFPAEIITQAFSCLVVPNAIKFANFKPIYVDIDETFNLDIEDLKRKISDKTKAIIIQNTFGIPAKIDEILEIAKKNNLLIIENLTHSLGAKYQNQYLGNFGNVALLSFNRNKVISSIIGGALIVNNKELAEKIRTEYEKLPELEEKEIKKILFTGKILYQAKKNYNFLTKIYLRFLRTRGATLEMISLIEKQGQRPKNYLAKFPRQLFPLLENQLKKLERFNQQRKEIAKIYSEKLNGIYGSGQGRSGVFRNNPSVRSDGSVSVSNYYANIEPIFLRFPFLTKNRDFILEKFKKENIYLGDWYNCVLAPCSNLKNFDYEIGSCPKAEEITKRILNLPTLIGKDEAELIISLL
ncbi:MAG: hypothetical protein KatS3mg096_177 [Candidatus Parcubacteria bacterium]|nr:MAG: hypothetical protein KatS3mg093_415 [Candidatus Parcubacteria bacterium]GIW67126.1 MAG: hypothetical protein KatS3mg095_1024 [Candidatus Parcubacteria bacterium]GIW67309.1 MAG: hypothetical protein KatS3mg096_177 [Candidatus Parcubacteria bacterium]